MNIILVLAMVIVIIFGFFFGSLAWKYGKRPGFGSAGNFFGAVGLTLICFGVASILFFLVI